ncbi:MAG: helix-turn-helix transcriptional regulator [Thermoflexales bacterium]
MANNQDPARRAFRRLLAKHEMTTKQVAVEIGVVPATLYNWLRKPSPTDLGPVTMTKVAVLFGLSLEQMQRPTPDVIAASESRTPVFGRVRTLRQIDGLLAGIEDPRKQARAAHVLVETLRILHGGAAGARKMETGRMQAVLALLSGHGDGWGETGPRSAGSNPPHEITQCAREWC